ncbi:helix-turn-helix domain-containing protein [Thermomonospora umbrina]|uniref:Helix-turn-helix protein n=1 Tax=Thermomonospora umbrina TaxID=111806 RepID=A0A3D9T1T7_9ACTN|nr:helix-turn-helix transcriptional regulator [Thermomonospora umbrina]REE98714.1 helix-turn-helix protein [Thermomonospora umbrina]
MGTAAGADGRVLDLEPAGPVVPRVLLGSRLRRLREEAGVTREAAGEEIRASGSKISRLELGRTGFKQRDVADLLSLYGVADEAERAVLLEMARQANGPAWWHAYAEVVPSWFQSYLSLEPAAAVIRTYEVQFVPGLLQTEEYARAVIRVGHPGAAAAEVERRVELRMRRQAILHRARPPHLWAVVDEAALRRPHAGVSAQREQIRRLIEIGRLPHVTVQVMSFRAGGHAAAGGPITLLRLPERELADVVYLEQLASAVYPDRPDDVMGYWHVLNNLATQAEAPDVSELLLRRLLQEL